MRGIIAIVVFLFLNVFNIAQINNKNVELSGSGTFGEIKSSTESTSGSYNYNSEGDFISYLTANFRVGYYLNPNFELEPELQLFLIEKRDLIYSLNANLLYHFEIDSSRVRPFILIGYGIGNSVPVFNSFSLLNENSNLSVHQFNAGLGTKIFVKDNIAIRIEYRFQNYISTDDSKSYVTYKYKYQIHNLLFGISFIL